MVNSPSNEDTWRYLDLSLPSAAENLALEEALARCTSSKDFLPTLRLWTNPPTVVVGRFQNVNSEVDVHVCRRENIAIARRFTGGGAVYQDAGNLNLTIVMRPAWRIQASEFQRNALSVVMNFLEELQLQHTFVSPNSVHVRGKKIAGGAAAVGRDFLLWHASILISTDIELLNRLLAPSRKNGEGNFIRSKWHPVITLVTALGKPVSMGEVKHQLHRAARRSLNVKFSPGELRDDEKERMHSLHRSKYSTVQWNLNGIQGG